MTANAANIATENSHGPAIMTRTLTKTARLLALRQLQTEGRLEGINVTRTAALLDCSRFTLHRDLNALHELQPLVNEALKRIRDANRV